MNDNTRLQKLFDDYRPTLTGSEQFNQRLERRLALVDEIRRTQAARIRRYRLNIAIALAAGTIMGGGFLAFILPAPTNVPLFTFGINCYPLVFIEQNSRLFFALLISLMIVFGIVALLNIDEPTSRIKVKGL